MDISVVIPIIVALIAAAPGIYLFIAQLKKDEVDATKIAQEAAISIIKPLRDEIDRLRSHIAELEKNLENKENRIIELEAMCSRVSIMEKTISDKEARILELERLVSDRECKIAELHAEVEILRGRLEVVEKRKIRAKPS